MRKTSNFPKKIIPTKYFKTKPRIWWRKLLKIIRIIYNIYPTR
ncbi:hypothetical protein PoMZ_02520 [Pyricularia oryzae]|uniref:Uncharacterized protein n=1 Tax=Pyricularia oryzae TaxID=318829 RepID=A0A4P7N4Z9_PYROR|nr:hypothetical protein PoMZ_02520 [Pyricularia oryzae]